METLSDMNQGFNSIQQVKQLEQGNFHFWTPDSYPAAIFPSQPLPFNSCLLPVPQEKQKNPLRKLCSFWIHTSLLWQVTYFMAILLPVRRRTEGKRKEQSFPSGLPLLVPDLQQREQMRNYSYLAGDGYLRYLLPKNSPEVIHYLPDTGMSSRKEKQEQSYL